MEEKGLFFLIVVSLVVLAIFVYLGIKTVKDIHQNEAAAPAKAAEQTMPKAWPLGQAEEPSEPASPKMDSTPASTPAKPARTHRIPLPNPNSLPDTAQVTPAVASNDPTAAGRDHFKQGRYAEALGAFKRVLAASPNDSAAKELVAGAQAMLEMEMAEMRGKWDDALRACDEAEKYSISATLARRRKAEIQDEKAYDVTHKKAVEAAEHKDYAMASRDYKEAARIAARLGKMTNDDKMAVQVLKGGAAMGDVEYLVNVCAERTDVYALYAAANYYLSSDAGKTNQEMLKAKLDTVDRAIAANRTKYPSPRVAATVTTDVLKMQSGAVEKGKIVLEDEKIIKLRQERGAKVVTRTLLVGQVAGRTKEVVTAEEANSKRAEELLAQAVTAMETKHQFDALHTFGILTREFCDAGLMKDTQRQEQIISGASVGTALKGRATLQGLIQTCVEQCEKVCAKCGGASTLTCPTCQGQGNLAVPCPVCNGAGKMMCMTCQGLGKLPGINTRCPACNGKGSSMCPSCKGEKTIPQICTMCNGAKTIRCEACNGTGLRQR